MYQLNVADWERDRSDTGINISYETIQETARHLESLTSHRPRIGLICGSGLGGIADILEEPFSIKYEDIPNFPVSTAPGHPGNLVFGKIGEHCVVCMQGRIHLFEGYPARRVVFPIRVLNALGIKILLVTNAAGGLNPDYHVGDVMVFKSHINLPGLSGANPHLGSHDGRFGIRFPPLSDAYDKELRELALEVLRDHDLRDHTHEGVYGMVAGPCYETVAEARMLRHMGADVTGMSTIPEVTTARHCLIRCWAVSLVTNMCVVEYDAEECLTSEQVIETGQKRIQNVKDFMRKFISRIEITES